MHRLGGRCRLRRGWENEVIVGDGDPSQSQHTEEGIPIGQGQEPRTDQGQQM